MVFDKHRIEKQKGKHITEFEEGDEIIKVEPTFIPLEFDTNNITGKLVPVRGTNDTSFTWHKMIYGGIHNNLIYLEYLPEDLDLKGRVTKVNYTFYQNGWIKCEPEERMLDKRDSQRFLENIIRGYSN